jgi:hypothetical protein
MHKKFLLLTAALIFVLAFAVACGSSDDDEAAATPSPTPTATPDAVTPDPVDPVEPEEPEEPEEPAEPEIEPIDRPAGLVYSFATDAWFQAAEVGYAGTIDNIFGASPYIEQAGGPQWSVIESPTGGQGVRLSGRQNHWDSMDIETTAFDWDPANNSYRITVMGSIDGAGLMRINGADGPYTVYDSVQLDDGGQFTLTALIDADAIAIMGSRQRIRVQTYPETVGINVYNIVVEEYHARADNVVWSLATDGLFQAVPMGTREADGSSLTLSTQHLTQAGNPTWTIVEGRYGNALENTNREANWNALDIIMPSFNLDFANNSYTLTVVGEIIGGGTGVIGGADGPHAHLAEVDTDGDGFFTATLPVAHDGTNFGSYVDGDFTSAGSRGWFRAMSIDAPDMIIHNITITRS